MIVMTLYKGEDAASSRLTFAPGEQVRRVAPSRQSVIVARVAESPSRASDFCCDVGYEHAVVCGAARGRLLGSGETPVQVRLGKA